jgi:hypothetical protein
MGQIETNGEAVGGGKIVWLAMEVKWMGWRPEEKVTVVGRSGKGRVFVGSPDKMDYHGRKLRRLWHVMGGRIGWKVTHSLVSGLYLYTCVESAVVYHFHCWWGWWSHCPKGSFRRPLTWKCWRKIHHVFQTDSDRQGWKGHKSVLGLSNSL